MSRALALTFLTLLLACDPTAADHTTDPVEATRGGGPPGPDLETSTPTRPSTTPVTEPTAEREQKRWLGISVANMTEPIPGAPENARAMIQRTFRGGPAHLAGLRHGDVIVRAAGAEVSRYQDYRDEARKVEIGDSIALGVLRDGEALDVTLRLVARPEDMKGWRREHFPGTPAFPWELEPLRPTTANLSSDQARGRPQLLYFWATWCSPCRSTAPMISSLHADVADDLLLVAISSEGEDKLLPWLQADGASYPVGRDTQGRAKLDYEVKSLPTAVLIDGTGDVVAWDYGVGGVRRVAARARGLIQPSP